MTSSSSSAPPLADLPPFHPLFTAEGVEAARWLTDPEAERARLVALIPNTVRSIRDRQLPKDHPEAGAVISENGIACGRATAYHLGTLLGCRALAGEAGVDLDALNAMITAAAVFLEARQSPEGWLDLGGRYSPNEAGFPTPGLVAGWKALSPLGDPGLEEALGAIERYAKRAAEGVLNGQAHTANHRWTAASAPLASVHAVWPDARYLAKIEDYLSDGIDCDATGCWYEERSPNYNNVANEGLWELATLLDRPELLEHVRRSGEHILRHLQPNGEEDASYSFRQDRGQSRRRPMTYQMARRLAGLTGDGRYTTLAAELFPEEALPTSFYPLLLDVAETPLAFPDPAPVEAAAMDLATGELPLARLRRGRTALTLCADGGGHYFTDVLDQWGGPKRSEDWFHLHHGDVVIQSIHLVASGQSAMQPHQLEVLEAGRFRLSGHIESSLHVLNFRPGSRDIYLPWDYRHTADLALEREGIRCRLRATNRTSLYATLAIYLRPGIRVTEGERRFGIGAGERTPLRGGHPVTLEAGGDALVLEGLPTAHASAVFDRAPGIPSAVRETCGAITLCVRFPVDLNLFFRYA